MATQKAASSVLVLPLKSSNNNCTCVCSAQLMMKHCRCVASATASVLLVSTILNREQFSEREKNYISSEQKNAWMKPHLCSSAGELIRHHNMHHLPPPSPHEEHVSNSSRSGRETGKQDEHMEMRREKRLHRYKRQGAYKCLLSVRLQSWLGQLCFLVCVRSSSLASSHFDTLFIYYASLLHC